MISVQNRQQLLSGNKSLILIVLIALTLQSCSVFEDIFGGKNKPTPPPPIEGVEKDDDKENEPDEPEIIDVVVKDTIKKPDPIIFKEQLNIAVILPFQLNEMDATNSITRAGRNSLEFYKGLEFAFNELEFEDYELNIFVFDNEGNDAKTKAILNKSPFPNVHAVIGPLYTSNIQLVADYAKENKIPFISPLASSNDLAKDNPYIISATATKDTRYQLLLKYVEKEFVNPNIGVLYQPFGGEAGIKDDILKVADELKVDIKSKVSEGVDMYTAASELLETGRENVLILPVNDDDNGQRYLDGVMSYLQAFSSEYKIAVVGLEEWNDVKSIAPAKYPNIDFYILDRYHINDNNYKAKAKNESLISKNKGVPLYPYTLQAYDLMSYIGDLVDKHGDKFASKLNKSKFKGLQTQYDFDEFRVNNEALFVDNKFINILQYKNNRWQKVNN